MKKIIKPALLVIAGAVLLYAIVFAWRALPIISGFGAKAVCSCVFNGGRNAESVIHEELGKAPLSFGTFSVNMSDSSASGSVFGLAKRKAIYRKGLGCTLINELTESQLKAQLHYLVLPVKNKQDSAAWPSGNLLSDTLVAGVNYNQLNRAVEEAFREPGKDSLRRTRAVLVVYKGQIVAEKYAPGFIMNTPHMGWSMTKSITNALIGILVKQHRLAINENNLFTGWRNDARKNITLNDLLHASSGLKWAEVYAAPSPATNMLYRQDDMGGYAMQFPAQYAPGSHFQYSSGTTNIISSIIRQRTGRDYYRFPYEQLFYKAGMYSAVIEPDGNGTFVGSSYCFASARDWARFGLLYLNDGIANGQRILPEGWVHYTVRPAKAASKGEYGAQFWLNAGAPGNISNRMYPKVPPDCFWADGYQGQFVWIIPSKNLVVVKLGLQQGDNLDENKFLSGVIASLKS